MENKKWPILAQILIGLGVIGSLLNFIQGITQRYILGIIFGILGIVIYWSVYKLKKWALIGLNILLSLNIIFTLFYIKIAPISISLIVIIITVLIIVYFNSAKIKQLFS